MLVVPQIPLNDGGSNSIVLFSCRGRSRQVSSTALARQASEERRASCAAPLVAVLANSTERTFSQTQKSISCQESESSSLSSSPSNDSLDKVQEYVESASSANFIFFSQVQDMISMATPIPVRPISVPLLMYSTSPSPTSSASMSPDHYDSPSPHRSLEDQVHDAYALEDIHLAKILLLRLKGIEVTSDDDPRIAAVQDEDFDFCFMPNGPLLNEQDEQALKAIQAKELERMEMSRRVERMRLCERKWVEEKQRMRQQKVAELRRRERKRLEEEERRRCVEERRRASKAPAMHRVALRSKPLADRKIVSYNHLNAQQARSDRDLHFVYDFMITGPPPSLVRPSPTTSPSPLHTRRLFPSPVFDDSRAVSFKDVFKSMEGRLFPSTDEERIQFSSSSKSRSRTRSRSKHSRRNRQLLDLLFAEVEYSENERRKRKGKDKEQDQCRRSFCLACSVSRSPVPSLSTASSRTSSWLSFRATSTSTSSTDLTTPSTSPIPSGKALWLASGPRSWVSGSTFADAPLSVPSLRHSCRVHNPLTPIPLSEGPLVMDVLPSCPISSPLSSEGSQRCSSRVREAKDGAGVLRRVSKIVELAKNFQSAYVTAALFSVAVSYEESEERHAIFNARKENATLRPPYGQSLKSAGFRASASDVKLFLPILNGGADEDDLEDVPAPKYIPLLSPYRLTEPPRTALPDPLPYQLHFKPIPPPIRSPFRHYAQSEMHTMYPSRDCYPDLTSSAALPPGQLSWRIRCVGNPAYLRLKALQNVVWRRGFHWEGSGRETAMGGGKERVIGVVYEYVGRSNLSYCYSTLG